MITTNSYLNFSGNCEEAFKTYEKILGGKIIAMMKARGTPMEKGMPEGQLTGSSRFGTFLDYERL